VVTFYRPTVHMHTPVGVSKCWSAVAGRG